MRATPNPSSGPITLLFARHGATAPNLAGVRCGGDLDVPLAPEGRQQAAELARVVAALQHPVGLIITADLQRTRDTAEIVRAAIGNVPLHVEPGFRERSLGQWNLRPIAQTQPLLEARQTPPGGESTDDFALRIYRALGSVQHLLAKRALLVASKGVGRVLGELAGSDRRRPVGNAELLVFQLAALPEVQRQGAPA